MYGIYARIFSMVKKAVIIYGAPGAGKGTQANLLSWAKGFTHFDTGKYLEQLVNDPNQRTDPVIKREGKLFDAGKLLTPSWVLSIVKEKTQEIAKANFSIVYSGSPRTLYEAFGDKNESGLIEVLERAYGKENIFVVLLKVRPNSSIFRNSNRKVCSACATAILYNDTTHRHTICPICGAKLRTRTLDDPKVIKVRLKEYEKRTKPILAELKKKGYKILEIDGEALPFQVHEDIKRKLKI